MPTFSSNYTSKSRRTMAVVNMTDEANETAKNALQSRMRMLQSVYGSEVGWKNVIIGRDKKNICSKVEIFEICQRSIVLCCAYKLALANIS